MTVGASLIRVVLGVAIVGAAFSFRLTGILISFPLNILTFFVVAVGLVTALLGVSELAYQLSPRFRQHYDKWARREVEALDGEKRRRKWWKS